ncbi:transglutaminase-like domain-containing protein [Ramlibacter albus]|uniref:Transglutaminase domain-containing protein n=1 Tax=Ramlibacter albus TaxID=2079448 RepID=A0A923S694_9BURK|nr:transglutaminase domain-containing protein [Ramlibacter albus]
MSAVPAHGKAFEEDPRLWLVSTPLLDLDDPKLRLKARSLTQLCKTEREKALAIFGFVKRIPFSKPMKMRLRTAREVIDAGCGDADDKGTVFVALLRAAGIPARLRYAELRVDMLRGLVPNMTRASRPVAEIWLGRWVRTDTYIFDAVFMAAARQRLKDAGWQCGYGIHVAGASLWNGVDDAYLGGESTEEDPMVLRDLGVYHDPEDLVSSPEWRAEFPRVVRALHWNVVAPAMERVIRELRAEGSRGAVMRPS